ncbi:ABC transporter substrate-binding protein [Streptomyces sp. URMC 129]|uniref:ABC transporter substrate-binding protein n=1 Tax=Streptomyces sp. URMC 129 TaxID=3423407 RepID=UPI003F1C479A
MAEAGEEVRSGQWRGLRDHLYARYRERSAVARGLWALGGEEPGSGLRNDAGPLNAVWNFLVGWAFQTLPRRLFVMGAKRRLRWFTRWAESQRGPMPFFEQLCELVPRAADGERAEDLDRVLVQALMTDLDREARGGFPRPWRRRRTNRFTVLFVETGDEGSRVQRFIRELRNEAKGRGATSLLVVADGVDGIAHYIPDEEQAGFGAAGEWLRDGLTDTRLVASVTGLVVTRPVGDRPDDPRAAYQLRRHARLKTRPHRIGPRAELAAEITAVAVTAALVAGAYATDRLPLVADDDCRGRTFLGSDGTCVGVQDLTVVDDAAIREVLARIEAENALVNDETADWPENWPRPRTVVYIGPLSGGEGPDDPVRGGALAQLRGLAVAQRHGNEIALDTGERVPLRVVVADAGDRYRDAPRVAEHIAELAADDPSVIGVVGMGQSRDTVFEGLRELDRAGLPVIGTAGTADELLRHGAHYYQNAPTNSRAAAAMAAFMEHAELIEPGTPAERALLVADARDAYSGGLADSFLDSYGAGRTTTLLYSRDDEVPEDEETPLPGETVASLRDLARRVCDAVREEPRTAVAWAARGSDIEPFLRSLRELSGDCPRLTLVGGDEVTNMRISDADPWEVFPGLSLYYVMDGGGPVLEESPEGQAFADAYRAAYGGEDERELTRALRLDPRPALAWDALRYLSTAVDETWEATGRANDRLARELVQVTLYQGLGPDGFDGATGRLDPAGARGGGRVTEDKLVLIVHDTPDADSHAELICGAVTARDIRTTWGDGHPCPPPTPGGG